MDLRHVCGLALLIIAPSACGAPQATPEPELTAEPTPATATCPTWTTGQIKVTLEANTYVIAFAQGQLVSVSTDSNCTYSSSHTQKLDEETSVEFTGAATQACFLPETRKSATIETMVSSYYVDCSGYTRPEFIMATETLFLHDIEVRIWSRTNEQISSFAGPGFDPGEIVLLISNSVTEYTVADPDAPDVTYQIDADTVFFSYP